MSAAPATYLAGGQSLIAAMKLGLAKPERLIDLQHDTRLQGIRVEQHAGAQSLWIGAMSTHTQIAASDVVQGWSPGLARLAGGIADQQVRNMGTIGGALANNDPSACWPAGVLAAKAIVCTDQRQIAADDFFKGVYSTALEPAELILGVRFPKLAAFSYEKIEQPASRFALVGVAVAQFERNEPRVAVTGLGHGVVLYPTKQATSDLHGSAEYKLHLMQVLTSKQLGSDPNLSLRNLGSDPNWLAASTPNYPLHGTFTLPLATTQIWQSLLSPSVLQRAIPHCEQVTQIDATHYEAIVKIGFGVVSASFKGQIALQDVHINEHAKLVITANAGLLGGATGEALIDLHALPNDQTQLSWQAKVELSGKLASFGNRLLGGLSDKLSREFFVRFSRALERGR